MAKKTKKRSSSKKKSGNIFTKVIVIIVVLIFAFFMISKYLISNKNNNGNQEVKPEITQPEVTNPKVTDPKVTDPKVTNPEEKPIVDVKVDGAWMNGNDQSLIIKDNRYAIYLSGIERDHPIIGRYSVKGNEVTFVNKKDPCEGAKGLYEVSFKGKNIVFKCKDDGCSKRQAILLNSWMWLDTDLNDISIE